MTEDDLREYLRLKEIVEGTGELLDFIRDYHRLMAPKSANTPSYITEVYAYDDESFYISADSTFHCISCSSDETFSFTIPYSYLSVDTWKDKLKELTAKKELKAAEKAEEKKKAYEKKKKAYKKKREKQEYERYLELADKFSGKDPP